MKFVHAWVEWSWNTEYPEFEIFVHSIDGEGSEDELVPEEFDDFSDSWQIDEGVGFAEEEFEEQDEIFFVSDENFFWKFLVVGQLGDEQFTSLKNIGVLIQNIAKDGFSKPEIICSK